MIDKRLLRCCAKADEVGCAMASSACLIPEVLSSCGSLAAHVKTRLLVTGCPSSSICGYARNCTPEFRKDFGCAQIDGMAAGENGNSPVRVLMAKIERDGGYEVEGVWYQKFLELCSSVGADPAIVQAEAWRGRAEKKFGVFFRASGDPSLDPAIFARLEQS